MAELIAIGFEGTHRAAEVLDQLQGMANSAIDLKDAVAVYRTKGGQLRMDQSVQPSRAEGAAWGGIVGGMLGALLAAPFTAGASVAATAGILTAGAVTLGGPGALIGSEDAASWKDDYGVSEDYVRQVGGMVQPGQSAVFALLRAADPEVVIGKFRGYGGKVLRSTLSAGRAAKLQQTIAAA